MLQKQHFFVPAENEIDSQKLNLIVASAKAKLSLNESFLASSYPVLYQQVKTDTAKRYRTFFTKFSNLNLLDEETSELLYEANPKAQSERSALNFLEHAPTTLMSTSTGELRPLLSDDCKVFKGNQDKAFKVTSIHHSADVIVVLGLGLGFSLQTLLTESSAKAIIIYEKNLDMVRASMEVLDWQSLFELATSKGIALFFQAGNNADSLQKDLQELSQALPFRKVSYYRHYPDIDYDRNFLAQINKKLPLDYTYKVPVQACLDVAPSNLKQVETAIKKVIEQKSRSFKLLKKHKPHMAEFLGGVVPARWQPYINQQGQLNALDCATGWPNYADTRDQDFLTERLQEVHKSPPTYRTDGPAAKSIRVNYRHYQLMTQFSDARQEATKSLQNQPGIEKPTFFPSLLINGIGLGYELAYFITQFDKEQLKIGALLEPDVEIILLSLYATDWLETLSEHLDIQNNFTFLLDDPKEGYKESFSAIYYTQYGAALASSLYFSPRQIKQSKQAINAFLQAHQQAAFAANYDDNRFHINHAVANLTQGAKVLRKRVQNKDTPVVLVGNGPSLDENMEWIKRNKDKTIIVSCGTSIYTLYRSGVMPDYHAEVEIVKLVAEMKKNMPAEFLKSIDLLASISAHPALLDIFNESFLVTRYGLEVTEYLKQLGVLSGEVIETQNGAPTCVNLAACVFAEAGYQNLILCGVDLAARDDGKHHASQSYYDDENFQLQHGFLAQKEGASETTLVEGYDGSTMLSKGEFIFAIDAFAHLLSRIPTVKVVNLSRGAHIPGSQWADDQNYQLSSPVLDKTLFKQRFARGFHSIGKTGEIYSENHIRKLTGDLEARFMKLDAEVSAGNLGLFDYFNTFRQEVAAITNDPAHLMTVLFSRSSRFYESQVYAFATFYYERVEETVAEACGTSFALAYEHWKRFCQAAIEDIKKEPYQLENSSLKGNQILTDS